MKRTLLLGVATALGVFGIAHSVQAMTIGTVPTDQIEKAVNNPSGDQDFTISLTDIAADGTMTDLGTTVASDGSALHIGSTIYITNAKGFQKQTVGATTATTIRSGSTLELKERQDKTIVVSNSAKGGKGSFVYNSEKGKVTHFSPTIREIKAASLVKNGTFLAMIAKNGAGKQKLFLSGASLTKLVEHPLPKYATSCAGIVLSPNKKTAFVGCSFNVPGKAKGQHGYALLAIANGKITEKRTVDKQTVQYAAWLSNTHLITIQVATDGMSTVSHSTVSGNKILTTTPIGSAYYTDINDQTVLAMPFQIIRAAADKFWYSYMYFDVDDLTKPAGTFLGLYDIALSADSLLLDDSTFTYFTDMQ